MTKYDVNIWYDHHDCPHPEDCDTPVQMLTVYRMVLTPLGWETDTLTIVGSEEIGDLGYEDDWFEADYEYLPSEVTGIVDQIIQDYER